jgi:putative flavoprotein involved in K+ transport
MENSFDVIVIGGGQSGLAVGYYLRRSGLSFIILDREKEPGGSWQHYWKSLRLFSPAQWSSLPGVIMNGGGDYYPTRDETIQYIKHYEAKYQLPVKRPVEVIAVNKNEEEFILETSEGLYKAKALVSATGCFANPFIPDYAGIEKFQGRILHSADYHSPDEFIRKRVVIVGEGNSGAQILAEVSKVADTIWVTQKEPNFLPDHVDGRFLFDAASQMYEAKIQGKAYKSPTLVDVVMVASVKEARERGVLKRFPPFEKFTEYSIVWHDGREEKVDAVIFCTGFRPSLSYLSPLGILNSEGRVYTEETKAKEMNGLWLVGFGDWTGFASATLIGVGRSAKTTVDQVLSYVSSSVSK